MEWFLYAFRGKPMTQSMPMYIHENVVEYKEGNRELMGLISLLNQFFMPLHKTLGSKAEKTGKK